MWWSTGSGRIELQLTQEHVDCGHHAGQCDEDIAFLRRDPEIAKQLEAIEPALLRAELSEYGSWEHDELDNHDDNLSRILWIACGDIADEPERYAD